MSSHPDWARLEKAVLSSPILRPVLERWDQVALPDGWLIAGAVAQTFWNATHGLAPSHGIKDVDIAYFDASDLTEEAEAAHATRINAVFAECAVHFDVKNQARVHLWYERKFGFPIRPYTSTRNAIATYPTTATSIGIRPTPSGLELCAPFGLHDLLNGVVRANKALITAGIYEAKVSRWKYAWPGLKVIEWDAVTA
jgi:uncharacterized protein